MFDFGCERQSTMVRNPTYGVLLRNQFCREISFVAIYALLRGEILSQNLYRWRKMTNTRYGLALHCSIGVNYTLQAMQIPADPCCPLLEFFLQLISVKGKDAQDLHCTEANAFIRQPPFH